MNDPLFLFFFFLFLFRFIFSPRTQNGNAEKEIRSLQTAAAFFPVTSPFLPLSFFFFNDLKVGGTNATQVCAPVNCSSCSTASA